MLDCVRFTLNVSLADSSIDTFNRSHKCSVSLRFVLTVTKFSQKLKLVTELQPILIVLLTLHEVVACTTLGFLQLLQSQL